jgi:ribosomal RNA-processing protein 12
MTSVPAPALMSLEDGLSKLRPLVSSKLSHQKKPALLLKALESSLPQPITPTAYYAALVQTIQQAVAKEVKAGELGVGEGDLIPAVLYLLAIVVDFVPAAVLHAQSEMGLLGPVFQTVDTSGGLLGADDSAAGQAKSVVSLFSPCATSAPSLRSLIAIVRQLLLSAPTPAFATSPYVAALNALLSLTLDPRPRVRKVAQEAVRDILASPPPPAVRHPYAERVAKSLIKILSERMSSEDAEQRRIWAVGFVRIVASSWPSDVSNAQRLLAGFSTER